MSVHDDDSWWGADAPVAAPSAPPAPPTPPVPPTPPSAPTTAAPVGWQMPEIALPTPVPRGPLAPVPGRTPVAPAPPDTAGGDATVIFGSVPGAPAAPAAPAPPLPVTGPPPATSPVPPPAPASGVPLAVPPRPSAPAAKPTAADWGDVTLPPGMQRVPESSKESPAASKPVSSFARFDTPSSDPDTDDERGVRIGTIVLVIGALLAVAGVVVGWLGLQQSRTTAQARSDVAAEVEQRQAEAAEDEQLVAQGKEAASAYDAAVTELLVQMEALELLNRREVELSRRLNEAFIGDPAGFNAISEERNALLQEIDTQTERMRVTATKVDDAAAALDEIARKAAGDQDDGSTGD